MSWSTPRTWVAGELVTASIMNTHVRDNLLEIAKIGAHRCFAHNSGTQVVSAGNTTALTLDSELYDSGTMHSTSSNTSRVIAPAAGYYVIFGYSNVTNNNNGTGTLHLRKNGSALSPVVSVQYVTSAGDFEDQGMVLHAVLSLAASDYVELYGQAATNDFGFGLTQLIVVGIASVV